MPATNANPAKLTTASEQPGALDQRVGEHEWGDHRRDDPFGRFEHAAGVEQQKEQDSGRDESEDGAVKQRRLSDLRRFRMRAKNSTSFVVGRCARPLEVGLPGLASWKGLESHALQVEMEPSE